jgi:aryl-alcohol dehydrogenase-like predicted oxidoreductase
MNLLGKTGLNVMPIGFGSIVVMDSEPAEASRIVEDAVEFGINYFDVAPSYGNSEQKLGPALEPFRKDIHLACKTHLRDAKGARETLDQSLEYLKTDYFDVFQLHADLVTDNLLGTGQSSRFEVGRLVLDFGKGRLVVGHRFGSFTPSFDGI